MQVAEPRINVFLGRPNFRLCDPRGRKVDRVKNLAVAKLLYALLFVGLLPLLLVIWAANTRGVVALRPVHSLSWGLVTAGVGLVLMAVWSVSVLWLVSTTVILASAALVLGYELPDMQARFGAALPEQRIKQL